jgi:hypothetical protein
MRERTPVLVFNFAGVDGLTVKFAGAGGFTIKYPYPTSLLKKSSKNNKPLCLQQFSTVPTLGIYTKYFSLTIMRNLMIAYKVTKL